jgi:hypothetical protein
MADKLLNNFSGDGLEQVAAKTIQPSVVDKYRYQLAQGVSDDEVVRAISQHLKVIQESNIAPEEKEQKTKLLCEFVATEIFGEPTEQEKELTETRLLSEGWVRHVVGNSQVFAHRQLGLYVGHVGGRPFKTTNASGLRRHLRNANYTPEQADKLMASFKQHTAQPSAQLHGSQAEFHLGNAAQHSQFAHAAHARSDTQARDAHLHVVGRHLQHGLDAARHELKGKALPPHHPAHSHVSAIESSLRKLGIHTTGKSPVRKGVPPLQD